MPKPSLASSAFRFLLGLQGSKVFNFHHERTGHSNNWVTGKGGLWLQNNTRFQAVEILLQLQCTLNKLTPQSKGSLGCLPLPQSPDQPETPHPLPSSPQSQVPSLEGIGRGVQKKKGVGSEGKKMWTCRGKGGARQAKWGVRLRRKWDEAEKGA